MRFYHQRVAEVGPGSVFFEKFFAALDGRADTFPIQSDRHIGDGIVTVDELAGYLKQEVRQASDESVNPQAGDISRHGSVGGFFFLNRGRQVEAGVVGPWKPESLIAIGGPSVITPPSSSTTPKVSLPAPPPTAWTPLETFRDTLKNRSDGPEMVVIPAGSFMMGSPDYERGRQMDEGPQHRVVIQKSFAMGRHEVTVGDFRKSVRSTGYKTEPERGGSCYGYDGEWRNYNLGNWLSPGFSQDDGHPVVCVSWSDAHAYINWLKDETGKRYRLPSEAEWEYAVRAGTTSSRYWSDNPDDACQFANVLDQSVNERFPDQRDVHDCLDGYVYTAPVGRLKPNDFSLRDMLGNVSEWTADCRNNSYKAARPDGFAWNARDCDRRMIRGGSWTGRPAYLRSANRGVYFKDASVNNIGFRLARDL